MAEAMELDLSIENLEKQSLKNPIIPPKKTNEYETKVKVPKVVSKMSIIFKVKQHIYLNSNASYKILPSLGMVVTPPVLPSG